MAISQKQKSALKHPWFLGIGTALLISMSGTFFLVYIAFKNPPSLVADNFYERGKAYGVTQDKIDAQKALGWTGTFLPPSKRKVNVSQTYEFLIQDKNALAIALDSVILYAYRASDKNADFSVEMTAAGLGKYTADVAFPLKGSWEVNVEAKHGADEFLVNRRSFQISE